MRDRRTNVFRGIAAVLLLLVLVWLWTSFPIGDWVNAFRLWILALGVVGVVAFVAVYVLITIILGPASALTLTAGLAYGFWGFPLVVGSATLAAGLAFLLGRYFMHERVNRRIVKDRRLLALNRAVSSEGWRIVALLRLSPLIPYGLQNYLFSVTDIHFVPYVLATLIGIMPATALYVYIGSLGPTIGHAGVLQWLLVGAGLIATAFVAWVIGKRVNTALTQRTAPE